jgi:hypothetical protein
MYLVIKIDKGGKQHPAFTVDLVGLTTLMSMATPNVCSFLIERIS